MPCLQQDIVSRADRFRVHRHYLTDVSAGNSVDADYERFLRTAANNLYELLDANPDLTTVVVRNGTIDEAITARMLGLLDGFTVTLSMFVQRGLSDGILDPDLDADSVAHILTGYAIGGLLRGVRGDVTASERERYVDTAITMVRKFAVSPTVTSA